MSKRITKEASERAARALLTNKDKEIIQLKSKQAEIVLNFQRSTVPLDVLVAFDTGRNASYYNTVTSFIVGGLGHKSIVVGVGKPAVCKSQYLDIEGDAATELQIVNNKIEILTSERKQLFLELSATIFALRTYERCKVEFPEAYQQLPDKEQNKALPSLRIEDLLNKLK